MGGALIKIVMDDEGVASELGYNSRSNRRHREEEIAGMVRMVETLSLLQPYHYSPACIEHLVMVGLLLP